MECINNAIKNNDIGAKFYWLGRMQQDCEYFLGNDGKSRHVKHLLADSEKAHIEAMRDLYNSIPDDAKPEWMTAEQIEQYAEQMLPTA